MEEFMKLEFNGFPSNLKDKKEMNRIISQAHKIAKGEKCVFCGKEVTGFCKSHSIPAFCLKNISINGEVFSYNIFLKSGFEKYTKGIGNAGIFKIICNKCDGTIFQDYENPNNYNEKPTQKMIAQIAMKDYLKLISKRLDEHALFETLINEGSSNNTIMKSIQDIQEMDLKDYRKSFEKAKRLSKKNWDNEYYMFYYERLNYVVPLAFQGSIFLFVDLDGNIINDLYCMNPKNNIQDIHICIFPLKEESIIMMFVDSKYKRYRSFYKKFNKLTNKEKLSLVNYIIFLYSEDIYLSPGIPKEVLENENLIRVCKQMSYIISNNVDFNYSELLRNGYDLNKKDDIPNLLSEKYRIK